MMLLKSINPFGIIEHNYFSARAERLLYIAFGGVLWEHF